MAGGEQSEGTTEMAVVGANPYRGGWFAVRFDDDLAGVAQADRFPDIDSLMDAWGDASPVLLGVPIGLPDARRPTRRADREARRALGPPRNTAVFPVPSREIVEAFRSGQAITYEEQSSLNQRAVGKRLSRQSAALLHKIAEVDRFLLRDAGVPAEIREAHRELCFWALNGQRAMTHSKSTPEGALERLEVLGAFLPWARGFADYLGRDLRRPVPQPVVLDTLATALTAASRHPRLSALQSIPAEPQRDARGLPMEMVYRLPSLRRDADGA